MRVCRDSHAPHRERTYAPLAVVIAAAPRQALEKNLGRTRLPTPVAPPQAASGREANSLADAPSIDNSQQRRHRRADALGS